jgi:protein-S-isoprenylcysteine O-methyltransferase Ste14
MNISPVGKLLSQAWAIYAERMKPLFTLVLLGWVLGFGMAFLSIPSVIAFLSSVDKTGVTHPGLFSISTISGILLFLIGLVLSTWVHITMIYAVSEEGRGESLKPLFYRSVRKIIPILAISIMTGIVIGLGFILLIIPGIIFGLWFWASAYVVLFEDKEGLSAMRQSKHYMKGILSPVLVRLLFIWLCVIVIAVLTGIVEGSLGLDEKNNILSSIVSSLLTPLWAAYIYLLYKEVKHRPVTPEVVV